MKKPINLSHIFALCSFFSLAALLLGINLIKNPLGEREYSTDPTPTEYTTLKLAYKTANKAVDVGFFNDLTVAVQFIDSMIFIPATTPRVEITGDKVLVDGLTIHRGISDEHLILSSKVYFQVKDGLQNDRYSFPKSGLIVKIYYQELKKISSNYYVKTIVHKGVFKGNQLSIYASADTAQFNVEVKYLQLHLEKPLLHFTKPLNNKSPQYTDSLVRHLPPPLRVVGTADLVEIIHNEASIVDLTQLRCRHVHADYAIASYSILEVAPTQLFSYIIPREDERHHSEMICKSKAQVTKARYIPELSLVERFH